MVFFLLMSLCATGQTRLISFRSHSGDMRHFRDAIERRAFDLEASNLGAAPTETVRNAQLDSVIRLPDGKAVLVTSEYCDETNRRNCRVVSTTKWSAGRDTVSGHPLFSKYHSLDSVKDILAKDYNFRNNIEEVVFVGYDNHKKPPKKTKKKSVVFLFWNKWPQIGLFLVLAMGSGLVAFSLWRLRGLKTSLAT